MPDMLGHRRKKVDNDHLPSKLVVRDRGLAIAVERAGGGRPLRVLDAFAGTGKLWKLMRQRHPDLDLSVYAIDTRDLRASALRMDNMKVLRSLDLAAFDLIDLDAYGWPTDQLRLVAERAPDVPVVTTCNQSRLGHVPKVVQADLNLNLPRVVPTLVTGISGELWEAWLYHLGYRKAIGFSFDHAKVGGAGGGQIVKRYELLLR